MATCRDGAKVVDAMKGWSANGPRGHVMIDPATRDIVQDEHAMEVISQAGRQARREGSRHHQGGEGRVQGA